VRLLSARATGRTAMMQAEPFPQDEVQQGLQAITDLRACAIAPAWESHARADEILLSLVRDFVPYGEQIADEWEAVAK
jgi:hypothetical protein